MKVSAFSFLRNGKMLGYPFCESIRSVLPIVDEFIIALGPCEDNTLEILESINDNKLQIIHTNWNDRMRDKGYVYAQQKMIAQFNCTGDWTFYLEADEVVHEDDLPKIKHSMQQHLSNPAIEALAFDYLHFYGNKNTYIDSPHWYRREVRIIKNNIRSYAVDGLFWYCLDKNRVGRYPRAAHTNAKIYHYGWVKSETEMNLKLAKVGQYWGKENSKIDYTNFDNKFLREFKGMHPTVMNKWLTESEGVFLTKSDYKLSAKDKKHRFVLKMERLFKRDFSKKHFKLIK